MITTRASPAAWALLSVLLLSSAGCVIGTRQVVGRKILNIGAVEPGKSKKDTEYLRAMQGAKLYLKFKGVWKEETDLVIPGTKGREDVSEPRSRSQHCGHISKHSDGCT
eukprot:6719144-Pyramimonas_sp.AAC.2